MPFTLLLYLGSEIAAIGFAIGTLLFLAWALIGWRGDPRRRRLRFALSSAALLVASVVSGVAMLHLVLLPSMMKVKTPDFHAPYESCSKVLSAAVPIIPYVSAVLLIRAINQTLGTRKRALLISLGCLLLTLPVCRRLHADLSRSSAGIRSVFTD